MAYLSMWDAVVTSGMAPAQAPTLAPKAANTSMMAARGDLKFSMDLGNSLRNPCSASCFFGLAEVEDPLQVCSAPERWLA